MNSKALLDNGDVHRGGDSDPDLVFHSILGGAQKI